MTTSIVARPTPTMALEHRKLLLSLSYSAPTHTDSEDLLPSVHDGLQRRHGYLRCQDETQYRLAMVEAQQLNLTLSLSAYLSPSHRRSAAFFCSGRPSKFIKPPLPFA